MPLTLPRHEQGARIGLFGGSFDPPHEGHAHVARTALHTLQLDQLWALVSPGNPLKQTSAFSLAERIKKLAHMLQDEKVIVTDIEAHLQTHYTVDLVIALQSLAPDARFVWVMGGDNLLTFHLWHRWEELGQLLPIFIVARGEVPAEIEASPFSRRFAGNRWPSEQADALASASPPAWIYLPGEHVKMSSSQIRTAGPAE